MRKTLTGLLFILLLSPSAWFAWRNRAMPQLGQKHDDVIYLIVSQSLAEKGTYRIASLPDEPFETKYPPVVPALLTLSWLTGRHFPENLPIATAIEWLAIPGLLSLALLFYRRVGLSEWERWIAVTTLAISPYTVIMGPGIFTEVWFGVFLLASLLACERTRTGGRPVLWALAGGLFAGLAYLTRTAGVVALFSGPAAFLLWRRRREAFAYAAAMGSCVAGWTAWTHLHRSRAADVVSLYNTDYIAFQFLDVTWKDMGRVVWTNLSYLLDAIAALPFPLKTDFLPWQLVLWAVGIGTIAGLVRCRRNSALWPYLLFCGLSFLLQLVWNFPPNLRFLYPLAPLFAIGLIAESRNVLHMISASARSLKPSGRTVAAAFRLGLSALAVTSIAMSVYMDFGMLHQDAARNERELNERIAVYHWIAKNIAPGKAVLSANPALFLYTGRKTTSVIPLPVYWYREDMERFNAPFRKLAAYAAEHGMDYVCLRRPEVEENGGVWEPANRGIGLPEVFRQGDTAVFRVAPTPDLPPKKRL